jgi:glutathione S-transferase
MFGKLPVWEEEDGFQLVQLGSIVRYLAKKNNLYPGDIREAAKAEAVFEGVLELLNHYFTLVIFETTKLKEFKTNIAPEFFGHFEKLLNPKSGLVLEQLSFADFQVFAIVELCRTVLEKDMFARYPNLNKFIDLIRSRPHIKEYLGRSQSNAKVIQFLQVRRKRFSLFK